MSLFDTKSILATARGALDAQRYAYDLRHGLAPVGSLADRLRVVFVMEREEPAYFTAFCRELEKAVGSGFKL
ncbi:MAG: hypothetical protein ACAH06_06445 [Methylophilaceae bacterium]